MEHRLYVGAAKRCITPPEEMWDKLRGMVGAKVGKVIDDLFVRVIAIGDGEKKILLVCFDMGHAPDAHVNLPLLVEKTGIPEENILYLGIHTHSSVSDALSADGKRKMKRPDGPRPPRPADGPYSCYIRARMLEAAEEALTKMVPARMGYALGESYINVNRNIEYRTRLEDGSEKYLYALGYNPKRPVDRTVVGIRFEDEEGKPIAFFINYAVHCTVMIWNQVSEGHLGISGDIGGNTSRYLEEANPGAVAMWTSGAAGDVNPIMMNQSYYPDPRTGASCMYPIPDAATPIMMLKLLSTRHYNDVLETLAKIDTFTDQAPITVCRKIAEAPRCIAEKTGDGKVEFHEDKERAPYQVPLHRVSLGDLALIGVSGEAYTTNGWAIQEGSKAKTTIVINHNSRMDGIGGGYILDDETYYNCMLTDKTDDFMLMEDNFVPGIEGFAAMPGTVPAALKKTAAELFEE